MAVINRPKEVRVTKWKQNQLPTDINIRTAMMLSLTFFKFICAITLLNNKLQCGWCLTFLKSVCISITCFRQDRTQTVTETSQILPWLI